MKKIFTLFVLILLIAQSKAQTPLTTAVDFTVTTLNGQSFNLFNKLDSNKFVLIDFYYCTCGPCQLNTPKVQYAYQYFGCNTSNVYFISLDRGDNNAACESFEQTYQSLPGCKFPSVSGVEGGGTAVCTTYGITAYPTVILIAPNKTIVERDIWPIANGQYLSGVIEGHGGIPAPVDINENKNVAKAGIINAFPNPANKEFDLIFNIKTNSSVSFEIYNFLGIKVMETPSAQYSSGSHSIKIAVDKLSKGTYFINMISDKTKLEVRKMIVLNK